MSTMAVAQSHGNSIAVFEALHTKLESIATIEDAMGVADQADAFLYLVKKAKVGLKAQNHCAFIRLSALRRAGELIEQLEKHKGRPKKASQLKRLSDLRITYNASHRCRLLARLPADILESIWRFSDEHEKDLTTSAVLCAVRTHIGQTAYDTIVTPYHVKLKEGQRRATYRMMEEVWRFTRRFRNRGRYTAAMNEVLAYDVDDFGGRESIEAFLYAFTECRARIDRCIEALERALNKEPVSWGAEAPSLLTFLPDEAA